MYGLNDKKRAIALKKIETQKEFLSSHYVDSYSGEHIPLIDFFKNAYINADRYIAEANHRVWSLYNYANSKNLSNVFVTITLPSEYHPYREIKGRKIKNRNFNNKTPKEASMRLSSMLRLITSNRIYSSIPGDSRCYFRSIEPHKSGVPHTHISFFIPKDKIESFKIMLARYAERFKCQIHVESDIRNPVSYVMKYILKTFDDLRSGGKGITDLSLWYVYHGISRFYTSRTLISLDVYRKLGGRYTLLELTKSYKDKSLSVMIDEAGDIVFIQDDLEVVYYRKNLRVKSYDTPLNSSKIRYTFKSKIRELEKRYIPIPVEFVGDKKRYVLHDGEIKEYEKPIYKMTLMELFEYRSKAREEHNYLGIYASERALIRRNALEEYSEEAITYMINPASFFGEKEEDIPF